MRLPRDFGRVWTQISSSLFAKIVNVCNRIIIEVFFKGPNRVNTPSTSSVRERVESMDSSTDSPIHKIFSRHERAERNRTNILESRVRALSEADEMRLQKLEAIKQEREKQAETIQDRQTRAMSNRKKLLSQRSARLKRYVANTTPGEPATDRKHYLSPAKEHLFCGLFYLWTVHLHNQFYLLATKSNFGWFDFNNPVNLDDTPWSSPTCQASKRRNTRLEPS